jgi:hypothetical protein
MLTALREIGRVLQPYANFINAAVVAAIVAGWVSLRTHARTIKIENITKERADWRDEIRKKALETHQAAEVGNTRRLSELALEFALVLNPLDKEDRPIVALIHQLPYAEGKEKSLTEFGERIALLLKHDWQRAKAEAGSVPWILWRPFVHRKSYEKFKKKFPS